MARLHLMYLLMFVTQISSLLIYHYKFLLFCRIVFAKSVCNFSECICELYSNPELSQDLPKGAFAHQFNAAFDVFLRWLQSKNLKVRFI